MKPNYQSWGLAHLSYTTNDDTVNSGSLPNTVAPNERGVVAMSLAFFLTSVVLALGLILDGGRIYSAEQDASRDAASAARVAAQLPDQARLSTGQVRFVSGANNPEHEDPEQAAREFLRRAGYTDPAKIDVSFASSPEGSTVRVEVHKTVPMLILQMIPGMGTRNVGAAAQVRLRSEWSPS
jgi:hypothetical protein